MAQDKPVQSSLNPAVETTILGFSKTVDLSYETALIKVKEELKKEGFGILTEIDVQATMKKKLDMDYRPYTIIGACNPPLAHKALQAEAQIGLMLPCKFIVYVDETDKTVIAAVDPAKMMQGIENKGLAEVAATVRDKFKKVMEAI
jgi:uncharacterized protein (DUF302 family)